MTRARFHPPRRADLRATVRLALPIVAVQVGLQAMGVVDTMMVGRLSARALAAVALGNLYFMAPANFGQGLLMALDPVVAQAVGARDDVAITRALQRGAILALLATVLVSLLLLPVRPMLVLLHQPAEVVPDAAAYVLVSLAGALPFFGFVLLRQTLQAMHRTRAIVWAIVAANLANAGLNWVLIFGHLGAPAMGPAGAAWASAAARWLMFLLLLLLGREALRGHMLPLRRDALARAALGRMVRLGMPIGATMVLEYAAFAAVALLMGLLGTAAMAAHQVAISLASLTFMVPLGVAGAGAVLVGHAVGRGDPDGARRAAAAALVCGAAFMLFSALLFRAAPGLLARLYTDQPVVLAAAAALIPIAGVFQVFDGLQVVGVGVLRGVADTRAPLVVNLLGFWLVGMPVSIYFGFRTPAGPRGLWWGLVAGLAAVAFFLLVRIRHRLGRELRRVVIDEEHGGG
ncbi:MAG: MATE family efflux transporter, partial [Gemmatimonadetes bacterium]|nr:MATE family efflux transporter [Gemmatimonadota bacterium]